MVFTPANLNGPAAADRMMGFRTYKAGMCLEAVDRAFQKPQSNAPGTYAWAIHAYYDAVNAGRIYTSKNPPKGAVVYLSPGANGRGHICISMGDGYVVSTDTPSSGRVGKVSIQDLCRRWGRRYLGWSDRLMGHNVTGLGSAAVKPPTSTNEPAAPGTTDPRKDNPMALAISFSKIADPKTKKPTSEIRVHGAKGTAKVANPKDLELIKRVQAGDPNILQAEIDHVYRTYLQKIN